MAGAQAQSASTAAGGSTAAAPSSDTKRELAGKLVQLQRGPEMERTAFQLVSSAINPLIAKWSPKLEALPKASMEKARDQLNTELKALGEKTRTVIEAQMQKSAEDKLLPAYVERFSEDEMRQLISMFESPVFRKYQEIAPDLGNLWIKDVVDKSGEQVFVNAKAFDEAAEKILGDKPAAAPKAAAPKAAAPAKK